MTTGSVYQTVINRERNLGYKVKCVEIGGTVGEYQNSIFLEAARIMRFEMPGKVLFMLVSYFPIPIKQLEAKSFLVAGINPKQNLVEIVEIPKHKFFIGTQFHPEFKSRPLEPPTI